MKTKTVFAGREGAYCRALTEDERSRTAVKYSRRIGGDLTIQTWNHRKAMARTIRMQEQCSPRSEWSPLVPLSDGEGY